MIARAASRFASFPRPARFALLSPAVGLLLLLDFFAWATVAALLAKLLEFGAIDRLTAAAISSSVTAALAIASFYVFWRRVRPPRRGAIARVTAVVPARATRTDAPGRTLAPAVALILILSMLLLSASPTVGSSSFPIRAQDAGCTLGVIVQKIPPDPLYDASPWKVKVAIPDLMTLPGYILCMVTSFFTGVIGWISQSVVAAVYEVAGTITGAVSWMGSAVINAFNVLVAAIETPLLRLGIIAPIASAIAMVILVAVGVTIVYFLIVVLNKLYEAA